MQLLLFMVHRENGPFCSRQDSLRTPYITSLAPRLISCGWAALVAGEHPTLKKSQVAHSRSIPFSLGGGKATYFRQRLASAALGFNIADLRIPVPSSIFAFHVHTLNELFCLWRTTTSLLVSTLSLLHIILYF